VPGQRTLERLERNPGYYRLLGFRDDIAPEHAQMFGQFLDSNPGLQEFLERPSVQEAFKAHRLDRSLVELALRAAAARELGASGAPVEAESVASQDQRDDPGAERHYPTSSRIWPPTTTR